MKKILAILIALLAALAVQTVAFADGEVTEIEPTTTVKYSSDRDTLRVECKSAVFHADFLLLRLSRFGNSTGLDASS